MKPPQQNRPGNRSAGGGGPRRPGGPGDGPERGRQGGPRPPGGYSGAPRQAQGDAPRGGPRGGPRRDDQRQGDDRTARTDRPHGPRPPHDKEQAGTRRIEARANPRTERPPVAPRRSEIAAAPRQAEYRAAEPRTGAETPRGTVWLYGLHAVAAALANPARRLRRLLLTEEAEAALAGRLRQPWPLAPERVERGRLEHLLGRETVHQGVALLADLLATPALAQALERSGPVIVLDQVSDPRNVGAILRSAQAFGAAAVIVQERNAPEETGALAKAASGALETVPLLRAVNLSRTLVALKAAGCWVVGLDAGGANLSGPALAERRVVLVLGSEGDGLRRLTRDTCDEVAGIAIPGSGGGLDSLNVSVATAVALYELGRRA
jgi:23S rRNA (guanosine2251-2'-O)-methyltransferase